MTFQIIGIIRRSHILYCRMISKFNVESKYLISACLDSINISGKISMTHNRHFFFITLHRIRIRMIIAQIDLIISSWQNYKNYKNFKDKTLKC